MNNVFIEDENLPIPNLENLDFFSETSFSPSKTEMVLQQSKREENSNDYTNSLFFISQFLSFQDQQISPVDRYEDSFDEIIKNSIFTFPQKLSLKPVRQPKQKKKSYCSPFHNFQKHLNNYLKKVVVVPPFNESEENYKTVARDIWEIFLQEKSKTKLVLHLVFNANSQSMIKGETLRNSDFIDLYRRQEEDIINRAKVYLGMLAIDQIDYTKVDNYLNTRRIQRNEGLRDYILNFKFELENGHMKRRIKMSQLQT